MPRFAVLTLIVFPLFVVGTLGAEPDGPWTWGCDAGVGALWGPDPDLSSEVRDPLGSRVGLSVDVSQQYQHLVVTEGWSTNQSLNWAPGAPGSDLSEPHLLVGWVSDPTSSSWFQGSVSAGMGLAYGTKRTRPVYRSGSTQYSQEETRFWGFSLPAQLKLVVFPFRNLGLGLSLGGSWNGQFNSLGASALVVVRS